MKVAATNGSIIRSVQLEMALEQRAIGRRIAQLREGKRLTQPKLAEKVHVSLRALQDWESGRSAPRWRNLERLAEVLEVREEDLVGSRDTPAPAPAGDGLDQLLQNQQRAFSMLETIATQLDAISAQVEAMHEQSVPKSAEPQRATGRRPRRAA